MKEFDHIESLENAVKWDYFKGVLGWDLDRIAYEMNCHPRRLTEWINRRAATVTQLLKSDKARVDKLRKELEKRYPIPAVETKQERQKREKIEKLEIVTVVKEFIKGRSIADLARIFKVDFNDFRIWWNRNLPVINQQVRQLRAREGISD